MNPPNIAGIICISSRTSGLSQSYACARPEKSVRSALLNLLKVKIIQRVILRQYDYIFRQIQKACALTSRQNRSSPANFVLLDLMTKRDNTQPIKNKAL